MGVLATRREDGSPFLAAFPATIFDCLMVVQSRIMISPFYNGRQADGAESRKGRQGFRDGLVMVSEASPMQVHWRYLYACLQVSDVIAGSLDCEFGREGSGSMVRRAREPRVLLRLSRRQKKKAKLRVQQP